MGSLQSVRLFATILVSGCLTLSFGQKLTGSYKVPGGPPVPWSINGHQTLMWGTNPYLPIGLTCDADVNSLQAAKAAGISDVVIDLPAAGNGWSQALAKLEELHMRYLIRISSLTPMATGVAVDPASYRIANVKDNRHVDVPLPGATEALVVAAQNRDGTVIKWTKEPVVNGRLVCDVKIPTALEAVILIYPTEVSLEQPDFWEGLDGQRDALLKALKTNATGPGLRGFVNPLGKTQSLPGRNLKFVPQSPGFRTEFATFLEVRYRNVVGAMRAWSMPTDMISSNETGEDKKSLRSFEDMAGFIPLWSGSRGIGQVYDPKTNQLFSCDNGHSTMWRDIADCVSQAESRRYVRMSSAIREIDDVPVVQEWAGWSTPYEGDNPCVDGIGMKAKGSNPSTIEATAAKATSSDLRWSTPGWLPATDIDVDVPEAKGQITGIADDLTSLGARGIFFRTKSADLIKSVAEESAHRATDVSPSQGSPLPLYFPENATNPAQIQRLQGGDWWLPAPFDGDRIDYGAGFYAYRMRTPKGISLTLWSNKTQRIDLRMINSKKVEVTHLGGPAPDLKINKTGIELTVSETPVVLTGLEEIPVPEPAYDATLTELIVLLDQAKQALRDLTEATVEIADAKAGFDRNPGGSFVRLRTMLHNLDAFMGRYSWSELSVTNDTNFSEIADFPGCSNNRAIDLHPLVDSPSGFYAVYDMTNNSKDDQEVWLAAKINPEDRQYVSLELSGQHLTITGEPIGTYGSGFGWYHLGTTKNAIGTTRFRLVVAGGTPDMAADAVLLAPPGFQPSGLAFPEISVNLTKGPRKSVPKTRRQPFPTTKSAVGTGSPAPS